jgi:DNA-binding MarR family transcriptional regulator
VTENELVNTWRGLLQRYHATWCALDRALRDGHQLGVSEFEVLDALSEDVCAASEEQAAQRMQDLGTSVQLSQSALSRVVGRLEEDGLVTRTMCGHDRRGIYVHLTEAGKTKHAKAMLTHRAVLAETLT